MLLKVELQLLIILNIQWFHANKCSIPVLKTSSGFTLGNVKLQWSVIINIKWFHAVK